MTDSLHADLLIRQPPGTGRKAAISFVLVTVLLDVLGVALIIPVLPALVGEYSTGDSQAYWYGALGASYGMAQFVLSPALGALSDRFGRRPVLLLSVLGLGGSYLLMGFAWSLWSLLLARLLGGATAATVAVASAYVADVTPPQHRSRGFGLLGAMFGIGFIAGPIVGGLLGDINHRWPFYLAAALCFLNALYGVFVLPESLPAASRRPFNLARANPFGAFRGLTQVHGIGGLIVAFALTNLAQFILHSTWVLYTTFRFSWTPSQNGISLCVAGLGAALVQGVLLQRLLQRWGEHRAAIIGLMSGTIAFVGYGLATTSWMIYLMIAANMFSAMIPPAMKGLISKSFDPSKQGVTMGALDSINGLMTVIGPLLGTALFAQISHLQITDWRVGLTFFVSALLQLICVLLLLRNRIR